VNVDRDENPVCSLKISTRSPLASQVYTVRASTVPSFPTSVRISTSSPVTASYSQSVRLSIGPPPGKSYSTTASRPDPS
jgi:hypothetical protein